MNNAYILNDIPHDLYNVEFIPPPVQRRSFVNNDTTRTSDKVSENSELKRLQRALDDLHHKYDDLTKLLETTSDRLKVLTDVVNNKGSPPKSVPVDTEKICEVMIYVVNFLLGVILLPGKDSVTRNVEFLTMCVTIFIYSELLEIDVPTPFCRVTPTLVNGITIPVIDTPYNFSYFNLMLQFLDKLNRVDATGTTATELQKFKDTLINIQDRVDTQRQQYAKVQRVFATKHEGIDLSNEGETTNPYEKNAMRYIYEQLKNTISIQTTSASSHY
jgi:hypothetical protein